MKRQTYVRLSLLASATIAMPAYGQVANGAPDTSVAQPGPASLAADDSGLADILVTAQRRSERLQDVPIAVSAATAETLADIGSTDLTAIAAIAPGVTTAVGNGGAAITIRGVGGTGSGADESANAVYVDGVYQANPASLLFQFNNIERIEVLKGPQGTLFGRNASGGLIQVITRTPQYEPEMNVKVGYGNYETVRANAYATGGLTKNIAIDLALNYEYQGEGWGQNINTGRDAYRGTSQGARGKLRWEIGEATSLTVSALYAKSFIPGLQGVQVVPGQTTFLPPSVATGRTTNQGFYNTNLTIDQTVGSTQHNYAATLKHDFGFATFTSITSRDLVQFRLLNDADLGPTPWSYVDIDSSANSWTQELQLASSAPGPLQWVVGLFYLNTKRGSAPTTIGLSQDTAPPINQNANAFTRTTSESNSDSYAAYAQATLEVVSGTRLTAGLRYTTDKSYIDFTRFRSDPPVGANPNETFPRERTSFSQLGWRLAVDQRINDDVLAYASYSRGFKSGLFNATNPGLPAVEPQITDALEIGLKSDLFDRRLRVNLSAFQNDISNLQLRGIPAGLTTPIFYNAATARFRGVDAEIAARPVPRLTLQANIAYLDGKYGSGFTNALFFTPRTAFPFGLIQSIGDASGNRAVYAPKWVVGLTGQYEIPTAVGEFRLAASYTYNDGFFYDPQNAIRQPSYGLLNGSVSWNPDKKLEIRLWANNITKKQYFSGAVPGMFGNSYFPGAPRTYGVTLGWSFGGNGR